MVETIDSIKLADALNTSWMKLNKMEKLKMMVQVNTSGEESNEPPPPKKKNLLTLYCLLFFLQCFTDKSGVDPAEASKITKHIIENCPGLEVCGLMTIGAYDYDVSLGPNPDFLVRFVVSKIIAKIIYFILFK